MTIIKREIYLKRIRPFMHTDLIKVLTGLRRSGKSVMLELIRQEILSNGVDEHQCLYFNFESIKYNHLLDFQSLYQEIINKANDVGKKLYIFLDEIQHVKDFEKCLASLRVDLDCDIYITGSNSTLLAGELASLLAGRYVELVIYPLSFAEFIELYQLSYPESDLNQCFQKYLTLGGMPALNIFNFDTDASNLYIQDLFNSVELRDIIKRKDLRDIDFLERLILYITSNIGTTFSASSISKFLKNEGRSVSSEKVLNYLKACTEAFIFYQLKRQDLQGKKILSVNEKYYLADHGLREAMVGGNKKDIQLILENIVCIEALRRGYKVFVGKINGYEVDFVCEKKDKKIYIQVTYLLASDETINREFNVMYKIHDNFPKYVVSLDEIDLSRDGIIHTNIKNFLLNDTW